MTLREKVANIINGYVQLRMGSKRGINAKRRSQVREIFEWCELYCEDQVIANKLSYCLAHWPMPWTMWGPSDKKESELYRDLQAALQNYQESVRQIPLTEQMKLISQEMQNICEYLTEHQQEQLKVLQDAQVAAQVDKQQFERVCSENTALKGALQRRL